MDRGKRMIHEDNFNYVLYCYVFCHRMAASIFNKTIVSLPRGKHRLTIQLYPMLLNVTRRHGLKFDRLSHRKHRELIRFYVRARFVRFFPLQRTQIATSTSYLYRKFARIIRLFALN